MFSRVAEQGWGRQMTEFHPGLGLHRLSVTKQESGEAAEVACQGVVTMCASKYEGSGAREEMMPSVASGCQ